ncbi:MAG TPA: flagellar hook-associated protein FlgK [Burkholderiaceae bacterium]
MSILNIGQSALAAAQLGLATTSNNIANASTPGYNREQILQTEAGGQNTGSGFIGAGANVQSIQRLYNSFLATQQNNAQSQYSSLNTNYTQISQINNMFANSTAGLSPSIQSFFNSIQTASSNPSAASSRETVLTSAQALASQFQSTSAQLSQISDGINTQLGSTVQSINNYATQIASLNQSIQDAEASNAGQPPNSLLDQRDQAVTSLSQLTGVTIVNQGSGYNVFIGNGQPLVVGTQPYQLATMQSPTNVSQLVVGYVTPGGTHEIPQTSLTGGSLSGLLQFRSQTLTPAQNALGQMAIGLADTVNSQQQLGQDLNGNPGVSMFTSGIPTTSPNTNNLGNMQVTTTIANSGALTSSNYTLQFDGTNYNLTRLSDNSLVYQGATFPPASAVDGLTFTSTGAPSTGDTFLIQPTVNGASGFGVAITNIAQIAMAAPIATSAPTSNTGTGLISAGVVNSPPPPDPNLTQPVTITFNTPPTTYNVTGTISGAPATTNLPYTAGSNITFNGWTVQITGNPGANDTFTVGPNTSGAGDSRNGVLMAGIQTTKTLNNGGTSLQGAYAQLVSSVGNQTASLQATSVAANTQLTNATNAQQSVSGVNLDEEASKLLQYQEAYQAAAKLMSTINSLFSNLLSSL